MKNRYAATPQVAKEPEQLAYGIKALIPGNEWLIDVSADGMFSRLNLSGRRFVGIRIGLGVRLVASAQTAGG